MKDLSLDTSKLTVRHALNIQSNFEDFPTRTDFLYDLVRVLSEAEKLYVPFQVNEIWHDFVHISSKKTYQEFILDQVEDGWVEIVKDKPKHKKFYTFKLIKHPWMKNK